MKKRSKIDLRKQSNNRYYDYHYYNTADTTFIGEREEIHGAGGGGGSCFPAGTFVRTQTGYTLIENLNVGDILLSYDRFGEIDFSMILAVNIHEYPDIRDDLFNFNNGLLICTGNHALYDIATNEHRLAHDFKVGDKLTNMNGETLEITSIKRTSCETYEPGFKVYNFEVSPFHTYFVSTTCEVTTGKAEWIKVHNGGGGGSKNSQARAAQEAPNTLRSSAVVRVLEVLSEGEIVGVVGGAKGAFLNATPIQNSDGSYNFTNVSFDQRYGLPSQTYIPGFSSIETEQNKNVNVTYDSPSTQSVIGSGVQAARVTIMLPDGLWKQDTSNGDLNGYSVNYAIDVKPTASGTWTEVVNHTLTGKTTSSYEISHRVTAPAANWDIRVRRISADDTLASMKSSFKFARWTEIQEIVETYNNTAYVGLTVPAESVGNQIPTRGYDVIGLKVQIPSNYNPTTRVYTGSWDGTFTTAWTDNTAWILYDLLTNTRYGVATYLNQTILVDKWEFYNCSVYNDGLVPDGKGGYEVRYTFNSVIQQQSDAWQLLHAVASNMRANLAMAGNQITLIQDRPTTATKIITNANVIEGSFVYSTVDAAARVTAVNVTFNDKNNYYLPRTISVENNTSGATHTVNYGNGENIWGYNVQDLVAFGCVTESYAQRMARWVLYSEAKQADLVTFSLALNVVDVQVGDVVTLMDNDYISNENTYLAGRVSNVSETTVTLSCPVTLDSGYTYKIGFTNIANDNIIERTITSAAGTVSTVTIDSALPTGDYTNKEFFCYSTGHIVPRNFKIIAITESERGVYSINAQFYDPLKWSAIEQNISIATQPTSNTFSQPSVATPTNITFQTVTYNDNVYGKTADLRVKWEQTDPNVLDFRIRWLRELNPWSAYETVSTKDFTIKNVTDGTYKVEIVAIRVDGKISLPATAQSVIDAAVTTILPPTNLFITGTTGTTFTTKDLSFSWTENPANANLPNAKTSQYYVEIRNAADAMIRSQFIGIDQTSYTYYYDDMVIENGVQRTFNVRVYAVDAVNRKSTTYASKTFTNAAPAMISMTVQSTDNSSFITLADNGVDTDINGYVLHRDTTSSFTPSSTNLVYDGPDKLITLKSTPATTYYYKAAAYDYFGKTGLNYTSTYTDTTTSVDSGYVFIYSGLDFTVSGNTVSWGAGSVDASYGGTKTTTAIAAGSATWTTGIMYIYYSYGTGVLATTTSYSTALTIGYDVVAVYKGGNDLLVSNGKPIIDGNKIISQSIGANQLTSGLLITNSAQIGKLISGSAHITDATIDTLQLKNGVISDVRFATSATIATLGSISGSSTSSQLVNIAAIEIYSLTFTTPNPTGVNGPFNTFIQAISIPTLTDNSSISLIGSSTYSYTLSHNLQIAIKVVRVSDGNTVYTGQFINPSTDAKFNDGSLVVGGSSVSVNFNIGAGGSNVLFGSTTLQPNTQYRVSIFSNGGTITKNVNYITGTPSIINNISLSMKGHGIYVQTLLR